VPTAAEALGADLTYVTLRGVMGAPNMPADAVGWYSEFLRRIFESPEFKRYVSDGALKPVFVTGSEFSRWMTTAEQLHTYLMAQAGLLKGATASGIPLEPPRLSALLSRGGGTAVATPSRPVPSPTPTPTPSATAPPRPADQPPVVAAAPSRPDRPSSGLEFGRYHAVLIGNEDYRNLKKLKTPVADVRALADLLQRDYAFANVQVLANATRSQIMRALDDLRRAATDRDNVLLYYAGHGWLDPDSDRGYWLPVDAEADGRANWLSNADVTDTLKALKAKHVLIVADSCYAGSLTRNIGVVPLSTPDLVRLAQKRARTVLTSGGLEPVLDVGGGRHSVFAKVFIEALRQNDVPVDVTQLFSVLRRNVMLNADQTPQYGDIRQAGHEGGDFLFVPRR
jgi:uncharacterized caspase-like protein